MVTVALPDRMLDRRSIDADQQTIASRSSRPSSVVAGVDCCSLMQLECRQIAAGPYDDTSHVSLLITDSTLPSSFGGQSLAWSDSLDLSDRIVKSLCLFLTPNQNKFQTKPLQVKLLQMLSSKSVDK